jgi:hypothetical protein
MPIGLKASLKVDSYEKLKNYIEYVQKCADIRTNRGFQTFIQDKFLETVKTISAMNLPSNELTLQYIENNKIREVDDGFILYNDTIVETESEGYNGVFSIALAFEYGTGLVGQENAVEGAWAYNVNQHEKGWTFYKDGTFHFTRGMKGFEIYRLTRIEIEKNLLKWLNEYKKKDGGASQ